MAINFYAGVITKVNNVETVENFVPVNIVKPVPFNGWNSGNAYYYRDYPSELNFMPTQCEVKAFDEEPIELMEVVRILFGIDDSWTESQYNNLFGGNSVVNFFSEQNISTKLNFVLRLNSVAYQGNSRIFARFQLGDISRAILFQWEVNMGVDTVHNTILTLGEEYSETSFENLLDAGKLIEQTNFTALTYDHFMNYPKYNLFMPMIQTSTNGTYSLAKYGNWQIGVNKFAINLSNWANWYTMITGKYYYGNPYQLELLAPINGLTHIDLGVPVLPNNQLAEGKVFENTVVNSEAIPDEYIGFNYYNVGTDLYYLFPHDGIEGTQTVALVNGYLQRVVEGGNVIFRLFVEGKGLEFKNCGIYRGARYWDVSFYNVIDDVYSFGAYIMVHKDWATLTVREWLEQIPSDYSQYAYGNNPFFFATYCCGYETDFHRQIKDNDYFDYERYPNSFNPGLVTNFHYINGDREYDMSACNLEYPIDFEFWETFLTSLVEAPSGPNIGGGSIGGGASGSGGGGGNFDDGSDDIGKPGLPVSIGNTNLFKMYKINTTALDIIGRWLHGDAVGILNITPYLNSIITLKQLRLPEPLTGTSQTITIGGKEVLIRSEEYNGDATGDLITSSYKQYDIGSFTFEEYFGSFLDYGKHTKIEIFLPMSGVHELDADIVMKSTIHVIANVNIISGELLYSIRVVNDNIDSVMYTFNGNCGCEIPITSTDYSGKIVAGIQTGMAGIAFGTSLLTGNFIGAMASGAALGSSVLKQTTTEHVSSAKGGVLSGSLGLMNIAVPYIMITRPKMSLPESYGHTIGYPCNISSNLSSVSGFTVVDEVHLEGFANATQSELDEIETALKQGVLL